MKIAVSFQDIEQVLMEKNLQMEEYLSPIEKETYSLVHATFCNRFGKIAPQYMYFGSEMCQYRIPSEEDVREAYQYAMNKGYDFVLVTPYVPETGFQKIYPLLEWLEQNAKGTEVVVNDWGILYIIKTKFPNLKPIVGRLLNKMIRDPRVSHLYTQEGAPEKAQKVFSKSSFEEPFFQIFLEDQKVKRIEYDSFMRPFEIGEEGISASMHIGFGVVATGRSCLVGTLHVPKEQKFKGDVQCKQQCKLYVAEMVNKKAQLGQLPVRTFQKGNTAFYQQTVEMINQQIEWAVEKGVDRIIISRKIPV